MNIRKKETKKFNEEGKRQNKEGKDKTQSQST